jgi:putative ABC transport system permease protein
MINIFQVAYKNLLRKKNRSLLTIVGIALAAWVLISLLGFNQGYEASLNSDIDNLGFQMLVTAKGCPYEAATLMLKGGTGLRYMKQAIADSIAAQPEVDRVTPMLMQAVFDPNKGESGGITAFLGVDPATFPAMKKVLEFKQGGWFKDPNALEAVMGYEAAELEQREVGDKYLITEKNVEVTVVGLLKRSGTQDDGTIFLPIGTVQKIFGLSGELTGIGIKVKKEADIAKFEERMYRLPDVQVISLAQVKQTIMSLVSTAKVMVFSIALIAILIAVVGVVNTILMSVMERYQEIGILKSMGAMAGDIFRLIWLETLMLCLSGGVLGTGLALLTAKLTETLIRELLPYAPTGGLVRIDASLVLLTLGTVMLIGLFSGIYPSWRAGRVRPLEAIRSETE